MQPYLCQGSSIRIQSSRCGTGRLRIQTTAPDSSQGTVESRDPSYFTHSGEFTGSYKTESWLNQNLSRKFTHRAGLPGAGAAISGRIGIAGSPLIVLIPFIEELGASAVDHQGPIA